LSTRLFSATFGCRAFFAIGRLCKFGLFSALKPHAVRDGDLRVVEFENGQRSLVG
jgi:hypothetical protein